MLVLRLEVGHDNIDSGWMKLIYERWTKHMNDSENERGSSTSQLPNIFIMCRDCAN
jgi:hypothetical protein